MNDWGGDRTAAHLEVITIDLVCESCGETNPPGTEFCTNCNSYLAWDRSVLVRPPGNSARPVSPVPPVPPNPAPPTNYPTPPAPPGSNDWTAQGPAAGYPEGGYPTANYPDAGYADQGYAIRDTRIRVTPTRGMRTRATTTRRVLRGGLLRRWGWPERADHGTGRVRRSDLPDLRPGQPRYPTLLLPLRLQLRVLRGARPVRHARDRGGRQRSGPGPSRAAGVPALAAAALPVAPGAHRGLGPGPGDGRRPWPCAAIRSGWCKDGWYALQRPVFEGLPGPGESRAGGGYGGQVRPGRAGGRVGGRMDDELGAEPGIGLRTGGGNRRDRARLSRRPGSGNCRSIPAWTWRTRNGTCSRCPRSWA